ncbi:MAG TPA: hypothetical protein VHO06_04125 [Polyangia bacterium]|nr:hypothetical protein [Polyangia bacterium]
METATPRARAGNLTAALVVVGLLELGLNRLAGQLFVPHATLAAGGGSRAGSLLAASGPFLFQLTAVLALGVLVAAFGGLIRRGELYPRAVRFSVAVIALVFAVLATQALVRGQLPPRFFLFLEISFGFLALLTAIAFAATRTQLRVKIGVALLALPGLLHAAAILGLGWRQPNDWATVLAGAGEAALIAAAAGAPFLLSPRPLRERRWRLPLATAAVLTSLFVAVFSVRFDLVQASALYGLRMELPPLGSIAGVAYVVALFGWLYATVQLVSDKGGMRLTGYGLMLLALGGYDAGSPVELSLSLLGLVAVAVGELRAAPYADASRPRVAAADWRAFVGRLATALGDGTEPDGTPPQAVIAEEEELEVSRIQTHRRGYPVAMKLLRRRGTLIELDATAGQVGREPPDASIERHRRWLARNPEHRLKLGRVKTGDPAFDQKFSVHGSAPLGDAELRQRIARQQGDGVLTLWSGSAARYLLAHPSAIAEAPPAFAGQVVGAAPVDGLVSIVDTLADLIEASAPAVTS